MNHTGRQLTGAGTVEKRRALDFYPTPEDVTQALLHNLNLSACRIWEPACGDGAMSKVLESFGHDVDSTDIRDTGYGTPYVDYIQTNSPYGYYAAVITNPPFNLSQQFIEKALTEAPVVAMLLKSQYWHAQKRYDLFNSNPPAKVLPLTWRPDFLAGERGGSPTMEVCWSVWIKGQTVTKYIPLKRP